MSSLLQALFAIVIMITIGISFSVLYHNVSLAILEGISASLASDAPTSLGPVIVHEIENIRTVNLWIILGVVTLTTIIFGYVVSRVTLRPARTALASQKQFIGNVAHELRTPLSIIKTNTEVLLFDRSISPDIRSTLESNVEELDRISQIINNLLSLSSLARRENMEFGLIDFSALVAATVDKYAQLGKQSKLEIELRQGEGIRVWGNTTALEQVVGNIVKNAINYTPVGGRISITVDQTDEHVSFVVQDSGIGIERKDLFRIFEPFYRAEPSRARRETRSGKVSGSGLGLTIVSELIKMHEGSITVRSALGAGTTVTVLFPLPQGFDAKRQLDQQALSSEIAIDFSKK